MPNSAVLRRPTLVLNRHWAPIQATTTRAAIGLVAKGAARIIDPGTYETHDLHSWHHFSAARNHPPNGRIRSEHLSLLPPEVILLTFYSGYGDRVVAFSRANLFRRDRYTCQYCGAQPGARRLTVDHIVPRSRGGDSTWENCALACSECNKRKGDRSPEEAGMRLRRAPQRPQWTAITPSAVASVVESWKLFLRGVAPRRGA